MQPRGMVHIARDGKGVLNRERYNSRLFPSVAGVGINVEQ